MTKFYNKYDVESDSESELEQEIKKKSSVKQTEKINNYIKFSDEKFTSKLGKYTFGLDKVIPWEDSNFVFSGGLLYDIITNRFDSNLSDIDLFFYGSEKSKLDTINKLLDNLDKEQYYYLIGTNKSVIYIFIQGIPRIIQLIMTNKTESFEIIDSFDLTHVMFYSDGTEIFGTTKAIEQLESKTTDIKCLHKNRLIKYFERGLNIDNLITSAKLNFVLDSTETEKIIKIRQQQKLYRDTWNLTRNSKNSTIPLDFEHLTKSDIDFCNYFGCTVNYSKLSNRDFQENINMFGAFATYLHTTPTQLLEPSKTINDARSNLLINVNDYKTSLSVRSSNGVIYKFLKEKSFYTVCKYISRSVDTKLGIYKLFFEIDKLNVINYLIGKLDKYMIVDGMTGFGYDIKKEKTIIESKHKLSESNIYYPLKNSKGYPNINQQIKQIEQTEQTEQTKQTDDSELFAEYSGLVICSKICNISGFNETNENGILDKLEPGQEVKCLFDMDLYAKLNANSTAIEYIDINLAPLYINL